ncbi:MAG TPA: NAD(+)/NADH kinase [Verrucomicrobiota bacterium]|nr:NAD(+)/NADH kinase [Verrucomicrobiota bacterium]
MKKLAAKVRRVGLIANAEKPEVAQLIQRAAAALKRAGRTICAEPGTLGLLGPGTPGADSIADLAQVTDLLLVFGGDGTMLRAAREVAGCRTPLLGINAGNLGFLTAVSPEDLLGALRQLWAGKFRLEERELLGGVVLRGGERTSLLALNDFVLARGITSRLIELEVLVDGELLTRYRCDGLIASSPTGSTAYSLAAGGAIVSPDAHVMTLTPICPHTLSIRPVVISLEAAVEVGLVSTRQVATLAVDGQQHFELSAGDRIQICRSLRKVQMVRLEGTSFFTTLRQKFSWSGTNV